jgi:hypothetical protein
MIFFIPVLSKNLISLIHMDITACMYGTWKTYHKSNMVLWLNCAYSQFFMLKLLIAVFFTKKNP